MVYVSGLPPFEPETGEIKRMPFEQQADIVLAQMKHCLEVAGCSLDRVVKCSVYCTPVDTHFAVFNEVYARYFRSSRQHEFSCRCRRGRDLSMSRSTASPCFERAM